LPQKAFAIRLVGTAAALAIWFWTQSLIGTPVFLESESAMACRLPRPRRTSICKRIHSRQTRCSSSVRQSSICWASSFYRSGSSERRPGPALVIALGLRQIMEALVALPAPPNAIWHYPGFPSLLVAYGVPNDYFFSGHTAIAVLGVTEIARLGRSWVTALGVGIVVFEVLTVLILRAHYTMDVFTAS
jgi:hypothetical protein